MLKEKRQLFEFLFMAADLIVVSLAWTLAYWLRFNTDIIPVDKGIPPVRDYVSMLLFIWLIWAFVFRRMGLYKPMRGVRRARELWNLINANALSVVLFIAVTYLFREKAAPFSRLVFLYFGVLSVLFTAGQRGILRYFLRNARRRGFNLRFMLIIGGGKVAGDIISRIRAHRELGIQMIGCLTKDLREKKGPHGIPIIGTYSDLPHLIHSVDIDQIVVALPLEDHYALPEIMSVLEGTLLDIKIVPDIYQFVSVGGAIEEFEGLPVISLQDSPFDGVDRFLKRAVDFSIALLALLFLSPLLLLLIILVKVTSRGPVFYKQERISVDGSPFNIYKFRTMYLDAESDGPQWSQRGDRRVTGVGRLMRLYSLDELPQLVNVLRGDMSIVGPRPERPVFIQEFRKHIPRYMLRHKVPAGMTGWAQVNGWRGDSSIDKRIEFDLFYIENWSLLLDFKIILLTLFKGLKDRNAC
jgi:Undecaprenyl-phosphate glucose phosphotransferase